uniref:Uncharacterized protein n=1 Tax=Pundamilia nyererei TaxID=303518 RepID=A0A3B4FUD5_9CICH
EFLSNMESHRQRGYKVLEKMRANHLQVRASEWEHLSFTWLKLEAELLRERAVFGPGPGVLLSQDWVQDAAEGRNRTRSRIRRKTLRQSKRINFPKLLCEVAAEVKDEEEDGGHLCDRLTFFPALKDTPVITEDLP